MIRQKKMPCSDGTPPTTPNSGNLPAPRGPPHGLRHSQGDQRPARRRRCSPVAPITTDSDVAASLGVLAATHAAPPAGQRPGNNPSASRPYSSGGRGTRPRSRTGIDHSSSDSRAAGIAAIARLAASRCGASLSTYSRWSFGITMAKPANRPKKMISTVIGKGPNQQAEPSS
jgi:hypothetical protein